MLLTIDKHRNKNSKKTVFSIAICRPTGQSSTMFLTIFDLRSSIVLTFSIATYPVWFLSYTDLKLFVFWIIFQAFLSSADFFSKSFGNTCNQWVKQFGSRSGLMFCY